MEKTISEQAIEGSLLSKLNEPRYFIMFAAFGLYWDSYSHFVSGKGLLNLTYTVGDAFPLGNIFVLIASFSLLASVISPALFWISNHLFWDLWGLFPDKFQPGESTADLVKRLQDSVTTDKLKLWAIKSNNSLAMSLAKDEEKNESEMRKNIPQPFLLALCACGNYFIIQNGFLRAAENALPNEYQGCFSFGLILFIGLLLYISFTGLSIIYGRIYLPGLKEHIEKRSGKQRKEILRIIARSREISRESNLQPPPPPH